MSNPYRQKWMTDAQWKCAEGLAAVFGGFHHLGKDRKLKPWGEGIEYSTYQDLATYDSSLLTRLVLIAHDRCLRASVRPSGRGLVRIVLYARKGREGEFCDRHPELEHHVTCLRAMIPKVEGP